MEKLCLPSVVMYSCGFVGLRKEGEMGESPPINTYSFFTSALGQLSALDTKNIFKACLA